MIKPNWYKRAKDEAAKPLELGERLFGIFIVVTSFFMLALLINHSQMETGFLTKELSVLENILLFGYWIAWVITASLESVFTQRLASRLFDSFGGIIFMAVSSIYFFITFPFDFSYFSTILAKDIQPIVSWISNDIGRVLIGIGALGMTFAIFYSPIAYKIVDLDYLYRKTTNSK